MNLKKWTYGTLIGLVVAGIAGCGGGSSATSPVQPSAQTGSVFLTGTDAPLPSIVSFQVQITNVTLTGGSGTSVSILSGPQTVDFARFNGLQTLLDFNAVPAGTYTSVNVSLANPVISYLNTTTTPPSISTVPNPTLSSSTVSYTLPSPLVVTAGENIGLSMDFNLRNSIQLDANGQVTGVINPNINFAVLTPNTPGAEIDEFNASVVSVNASAGTFVVQGAHGQQFTVQTNNQTMWENGDTINSLVAGQTIVAIAGQLQPSSQTITADDIAVLSQHGFYAAGLVTYVKPSSGAASNFNMLVNGTLPTGTAVTLGQIANVQLTGNEKFYMFRHKVHDGFLQFLFNSSMMVPAQDVAVGGATSGAQNAQALSVDRVVLRFSGVSGTVVPGSVSTSTQSFQLNADGIRGVLFNGPVTVYIAGDCGFRWGFNGIGDLKNATGTVRVVGFVLKDPANGQTIILGRFVDDKHNEDSQDMSMNGGSGMGDGGMGEGNSGGNGM